MSDNFKNVNHLVLNFYPDGYSIAVKLNEFPVFTSETILETAKISYEETSLLDYIENEELPPLLVEMIDGSPKLSQYKIWHNGCLILEVRDKINTDNNSIIDHENTYFVLLKPTNLSMLNDVSKLTESSLWSTEDRLQLESQIVLHNSPPLFLEPDVSKQPMPISHLQEEQNLNNSNLDGFKSSNIYTKHKRKFPHNDLKKNYSPSTQTSQQVNLPPELTLQQFLATKRAKKNFSIGHLARFHRFKKNG